MFSHFALAGHIAYLADATVPTQSVRLVLYSITTILCLGIICFVVWVSLGQLRTNRKEVYQTLIAASTVIIFATGGMALVSYLGNLTLSTIGYSA